MPKRPQTLSNKYQILTLLNSRPKLPSQQSSFRFGACFLARKSHTSAAMEEFVSGLRGRLALNLLQVMIENVRLFLKFECLKICLKLQNHTRREDLIHRPRPPRHVLPEQQYLRQLSQPGGDRWMVNDKTDRQTHTQTHRQTDTKTGR